MLFGPSSPLLRVVLFYLCSLRTHCVVVEAAAAAAACACSWFGCARSKRGEGGSELREGVSKKTPSSSSSARWRLLDMNEKPAVEAAASMEEEETPTAVSTVLSWTDGGG